MAKRIKCTPENFPKVVDQILEEYGGEVGKNCDEFTKIMGKRGSQLLKESSKAVIGGKKYYKSWTYKVDKNKKLGYTAIIYSRMPGLPHLLEKSHPTGQGGKYTGRDHIASAEEILIAEYERGIKEKI